MPRGLIVSCQARAGNPLHGAQFLGAMALAARSTLEEGRKAADWGATYVATTLSGYTQYTEPKPEEPDYPLLEALARELAIPVIAEGRYNTPDLVQRAFRAGAHAVVVGTMITNPREITRSFVTQGVPL